MGYMHINSLYKDQRIFLFKECYALEKVHGTSAHISYLNNPHDPRLGFFAGGASYEAFCKLFDEPTLRAKIMELCPLAQRVKIHGEAYGGKMQAMSHTYGKDLRFIVFDICIDDKWLSVPDMDDLATALGLEVVPYEKVLTALEELDRVRDKPSEVAQRRDCGSDKQREGVVLRPLLELTMNNGERLMSKHRIDKYNERATPQKIVDPAKLQVLAEAKAIADEWVTPMRLLHVLDKLPGVVGMENTKQVIAAMTEDVYREAAGEIVESKDAAAAIGTKTAQLLKQHLLARLKNAQVN